MDAALLDLYDTVARTHWGQLSDRISAELDVPKERLFRAYDVTRPARSVGEYGSAAGDMTAIVEAAGVEPEPVLIERLLDLEHGFAERGVQLWEDALPVVRELRSRGIRTALISNCSHSTRPIVDRLGLEDEFDATLLSFEIGLHKPDPRIYREALRRLGDVAPGRAVFVDDQTEYCDGAAALGIETYLIVRDGEAPPDLDGHRVISDLRSLLARAA
ncbi:MAG TPA: HAD-IA family hydrolase [Actinomycetota bacterium]|nr:HAD-IA family hydrolase [Actinomycetota bacterium]